MIPFVTGTQLVLHGVGDYILQSHWMASEKTEKSLPAAVHSVTYVLPFLFLTTDWLPLLVMATTHFFIDRFRLARYVVWFKNLAAPKKYRLPLDYCPTGYPNTTAPYLATWLLIIADNLIHIGINALCLNYL